MDPKFWLDKWSSNQIGFHENKVHNLLMAYWHSLGGEANDKVFVPLCGKSLDLLWLRERHNSVVGVELSEIAVISFFEEQGLNFTKTERGEYSIFSNDGIQILCGDIFKIPSSQFGIFDLVYDRASLVALSPSDRIQYRKLLDNITRKESRILLITVDYDSKLISPPPHILSDIHLQKIYASDWKITSLDSQEADIKGTTGQENCYRIEKK